MGVKSLDAYQKKIEAAQQQLNKGVPFSQVAASFSEAPDALSGGDLGWRPASRLPANHEVIRALLELKLYDQALDELRYAQKVWGDAPPIQATIAWVYEQQGQAETGQRQFSLLRGAITNMRRAYPQFLAAGGRSAEGPIDYVNATLGFANGVVASLTASKMAHRKIRSLSAHCRRALVETDFLNRSLQIHRRTNQSFSADHAA